MATRTTFENDLHRMANYVECQLAYLIHELLVDGRAAAVSDLAWQGSRFVQTLREIRDGKEGDMFVAHYECSDITRHEPVSPPEINASTK